jgi:hypothetical protein
MNTRPRQSLEMMLVAIVLSFVGMINPLQAQQETSFAAHPLFKLLIGEWKSEGILQNADGKEVKIVEEWTGKASAEGEFVMEGHRMISDEKQEYTWTFSHNANTGLYEATHIIKSNGGDIKRFEASISEVDLTMELRFVGDGSSSIVVKDSFPRADHDTLESEVTLTGSGGETNLSGKLIHKRVKKP